MCLVLSRIIPAFYKNLQEETPKRRKIPILAIVDRSRKLEKSGRGLKRSRHTSMLVLGMIGIKWKKKTKKNGSKNRLD